MRIALTGSVDAGKTTLYKYLTGEKIKELNNRTEGVRVTALEPGVDLIDSPGHCDLSASREDAIRMADLIIFVIDCQKPNLALIPFLTDIPILIVLNKWDMLYPSDTTRPLKELALAKDNFDFYSRIDAFSGLFSRNGRSVHPFLDITDAADIVGAMCPLAASTGWGTDLLKNLVRRYAKSYPSSGSYLYRERSETYIPIGPVSDSDRLNTGQTIKMCFTSRGGKFRVRAGVTIDDRILGLNGVRPREFKLNEEHESGWAKFLLDRKVNRVCVFADYDSQWANLSSFLRTSGLTVERISKKALDCNSEKPLGVFFAIQPEAELMILDPFGIYYASESVISLIAKILTLRDRYAQLNLKDKQQAFRYAPFLETDPTYLFLDGKKQKIIGCKVLEGTLKPNLWLDLYTEQNRPVGRVRVRSLKDKDKLKSQWTKSDNYVAVRFQLVSPIDFKKKLWAIAPIIFTQWTAYNSVTKPSQDLQRFYQACHP